MIIKTSYPFMKPPPSARLIRGHRLAQGLVGAWLFNEGGGLQVFDLSENGISCVETSAPLWVGDKFGWAKYLEDADYFTLGDMTSRFSTEATFVIWLRKWDINGPGAFKIGTAGLSDHYPFAATTVYLGVFRDDRINCGAPIVDLTEWHMLTVVNRPGTNGWKVYQNTKLLNQTTGEATISLQAAPIIGKNADNDDIRAIVSHFMFYNRAISEGEIAELYAKPFGMFERRARTALMSGYEVGVPPTLARAKIDCGLASTSPLIRGLVA